MKRYKTGFPIAVYDVVNSRSPTYLIALSGMETERRGQATMPGDAYFAWSNIKPLDAYYMAIIDAVKKAIATTSPDGHPIHPTLIIAGHSLGGIEAQNVVAELGSLGYNVVQVVSYGATIQWTVVPGTRYLHVRAPNEALQRWDRRSELGREFSDDCVQVQGIMFSGMGTGAIYGPTGSHNNFAQDSSGLNQRRVPPINTLTSQCYDVELIQAFSAPDMATRVSGGTGCLPPAQVAPKCSFRPKAALPQSCGNNNPMDRGLLNPDENFLKQLAKQMCLVFLVRDSSAPALLWVGKAGYKPKPQDIKGKTLKLRDLQAIGIPPNLFNQYLGLASARGMTAKDRLDLRQKGYKIVGAAEIITDSQGNKFYSDTDLHGVYDMNGNNGWTDNLLSILQCGTLDQGIQHDPHDQWPDRNDPAKAGANWGPQIGRDPTRDCKPTNFGDDEQPCKSVTAIFPDGSTLRVCSLDQMKQLYSAMGVNFKSIYPAF